MGGLWEPEAEAKYKGWLIDTGIDGRRVDVAFHVCITNIFWAVCYEVMFDLDFVSTKITKTKKIKVTYLEWFLK